MTSLLARIIRLKPDRIYDVVFHDSFNKDIAGHPRAAELLEETDRDLSIPEKDLRRNTITKVEGITKIDVFRYSPGTDKDIRIFYWPDQKKRHVFGTIPRSTDYRKKDLELATERALAIQREERKKERQE